MSSYFTRLAARLAPAGRPNRQEQADTFNPASQAVPAMEAPLVVSPSIATTSKATDPGPGPGWFMAPLPVLGTAPAGGAMRGAREAPVPTGQATAALPAHDAGHAPRPQVGQQAPLATAMNAPPPPPNRMSRVEATVAVAVAGPPEMAVRLSDPGATSGTTHPEDRPSLAHSGPPEAKAGMALEHGATDERQAAYRRNGSPTGALGLAPLPGPATHLAARPALGSTRPADTPRSRREPAAPRIDVHIGVITLTVHAPAPAPALAASPAPRTAARAEPRPAFSASRHYLRCP